MRHGVRRANWHAFLAQAVKPQKAQVSGSSGETAKGSSDSDEIISGSSEKS